MFKKLAAGGAVVAVGVLLATNPTVVEAAGQITGGDIKNNSVASKDIKNNTIKGGDVADGGLTGQDIGDGSLSLADLGANSVNSSKIGDGTVTSGDIADGTVTSGDVANGTLSHADLSAGSIGIARGYAWNDLDTTTIGVVTPLTNVYTYNSTGGGVTVRRDAVGAYSIAFPGLDWEPGNVQVTGYGATAVFCNVGGWGAPTVAVRCWDAAGAPANSRFTVAVFE